MGGGVEIGKDIVNILSTAGLRKDVIDLLKEKLALLTEKIAILEGDKLHLQTENTNLKSKIRDLEYQLQRLQPKDDAAVEPLEPMAENLLQSFAQSGLQKNLSINAALLRARV